MWAWNRTDGTIIPVAMKCGHVWRSKWERGELRVLQCSHENSWAMNPHSELYTHMSCTIRVIDRACIAR